MIEPDERASFHQYAMGRLTDREVALFHRALAILHMMGTERYGWRSLFGRWAFSDEPLRNDAANLVREAGFQLLIKEGERLIP